MYYIYINKENNIVEYYIYTDLEYDINCNITDKVYCVVKDNVNLQMLKYEYKYENGDFVIIKEYEVM